MFNTFSCEYSFLFLFGILLLLKKKKIAVSLEVVETAGNMKTKKLKTANGLMSIIVLVLFCGSAVGLRPKLFSAKGHKAALAPAASDDGICASVVEAQNYVCEEHKVTYPKFITITKFLRLRHTTNY